MARSLSIALVLLVILAAPAGATPGALDRGFGTNGLVRVGVGASAIPAALAKGPGGTLIVAGTADNGQAGDLKYGPYDNDMALVRITRTGQLDQRFGQRGRVTLDLGQHENVAALAMQPDGKIVVAGATWSRGSPHGQVAVARFDPDGTPDRTFGGAGYVIGAPAGRIVSVSAISVEPDGRLTVTGGLVLSQGPPDTYALTLSLLPDGRPDLAFQGDGDLLSSPVPPTSASDQFWLPLASGGSVVSGRNGILRGYRAEGTPDRRWRPHRPPAGFRLEALASSGSRVVAVGSLRRSPKDPYQGSHSTILIARYLTR